MATHQIRSLGRALTLLAAGALQAWGAPPDWLQAASHEPLPPYAENPPAVMLRQEQITTVKNGGEVTVLHRRAYKILRQEGREYGTVRIFFDSETRIGSLKAWSLSATGGSFEVGEKDALETVPFSGNLYEDTRERVLRIPAAEPGAVVGYEYEQHGRPSVLQEHWSFQAEVPVRLARMTLRLPAGWEYREYWANHAAVPLQPSARNQFVWEIRDVPAIQIEPAMPTWRASVGQLLLAYVAPGGASSLKSWDEIGQWYSQLTSDRRQATPELQQKVMALTAGGSTVLAKAQLLASFVQREIRYVAIEIGIGGYQPHAAADILRNRYGDCKDKATLLSTMLREIGLESYYVLINSRRGVVMPGFPSPYAFDHAILAIRVPQDAPSGSIHSLVAHPRLGQLLFFDPTQPYVRFGDLPAELQSSYGLVVANNTGELTKLPLLPAPINSMRRTVKLRLLPDGSAEGDVQETRSGASAADFRGAWLNLSESDQRKGIQESFGRQPTSLELKNFSVKGLDQLEEEPELSYSFRLVQYANSAGGLLLLRPRMLAEWGNALLENGERKQPVEFPAAMLRTESIEFTLPEGWGADELPPPVQADIAAASYGSKSEMEGRVLRYSRRLEIRDVLVDKEQIADLKKFYRQVAADERAKAVLKRQ
jgi:transglutaminase-like putative cysteine protease